jgi:hypothetical protein
VDVTPGEHTPRRDQQQDAGKEPQRDLGHPALLESRLEQAEQRRDGHRADRVSEQDRPQELGLRAHEEDGQRAEPRRESGCARRED